MENLYFDKTVAKRNDGYKIEKLGIEVENNKMDDFKYCVKLTVKTANKDIFVEVVLVGEFTLDSSVPKEIEEILIERNTIAIMFPYRRSQISLLSTQPGVEPIVIPPINVNKLIKEKK